MDENNDSYLNVLEKPDTNEPCHNIIPSSVIYSTSKEYDAKDKINNDKTSNEPSFIFNKENAKKTYSVPFDDKISDLTLEDIAALPRPGLAIGTMRQMPDGPVWSEGRLASSAG